jgi:hypothetical protein
MSAPRPSRRPPKRAANDPEERWELARDDHGQQEPLHGGLRDTSRLLAIAIAIAIVAATVAVGVLLLLA